TDAAGNTYTFGPGQYRFPYVAPGTYRLVVTPPASHLFPSQVPDAQLQLLPTGPFALVVGSRGEVFTVNPGPALNIDIPLDPNPIGIFLQKTSAKTSASVGDFVPFTVTAEVPGNQAVTNVTIVDRLPLGFRYEKGTARLDGIPVADPRVSTDGRTLTFANLVANFAAGGQHTLEYLTAVTANARIGTAVNTATATGQRAGLPVGSNRATASLEIVDDLIRTKGFIVGRVFVDGGWRADGKHPATDGNAWNDPGEEGVAGVKVFLEDGTFTVTDENGFYHFEGVTPGTHVVQIDLDSLHRQYELAPLPNTRFAGRAFSQFVEVRGGGIWRANFRLIRREPPAARLSVDHALSTDSARVWATVTIRHEDKVRLDRLEGVYLPPAGWHYVKGTATVDGNPAEPEQTITGLVWKLDPARPEHVIRLALAGDGEPGDKKAVAYARFASPGTPNGRTGLAVNTIHDELAEERLARTVDLHLNFDTLSADLKPEMMGKLEALVNELKKLEITRIEVIGHTDNRRI
ncbi:MAG: DUF11 domain-containing protein, partial [Deltaproteobacteria bacterium]